MSTTTAMSSTSAMPIITRPCRECSSPRSISRRAITIVLATEMTMPTTTPWTVGQPSKAPTAEASEIESTMPRGAPTMATHFTRSRSRRDSSIPIENMSRITPISANSSNRWTSVTASPGVKGLSRRPPST
jgi:hypothetical protein